MTKGVCRVIVKDMACVTEVKQRVWSYFAWTF